MSWLTFNNTSGECGSDIVIYTVETNNEHYERVADITLTNKDGLSASTKVTQLYNPSTLVVSPSEILLSETGETDYPINIYTDREWLFSTEFNCSARTNNDRSILYVSVPKNTGSTELSGTGRFEISPKTYVDVTFKQEVYNGFTVSPLNYSASSGAGSFTINVECEEAWSASTDAGYLTLSATGGTGNGSITVNYTENTSYFNKRYGIISFIDYWGSEKEVTFSQDFNRAFVNNSNVLYIDSNTVVCKCDCDFDDSYNTIVYAGGYVEQDSAMTTTTSGKWTSALRYTSTTDTVIDYYSAMPYCTNLIIPDGYTVPDRYLNSVVYLYVLGYVDLDAFKHKRTTKSYKTYKNYKYIKKINGQQVKVFKSSSTGSTSVTNSTYYSSVKVVYCDNPYIRNNLTSSLGCTGEPLPENWLEKIMSSWDTSTT